MRNCLSLIVGCAFCATAQSRGAVLLFEQDYDASSTLSDYVSTTPDQGQTNSLGSSGAAKTWSITSGALTLASTGANAAFASRTTDFPTAPAGVMLSFNVSVGSTSNLTSAFQFMFGSGFGTGNSVESNSNVHSKLGLNFTSEGAFSVRDVSGSTNGAGSFATGSSHTITFVTNNSGSSFHYLAPDGSQETVADDTWDIWVGTSKQLNDRAATSAGVSITDFKFGSASDGTFSLSIDDLQITAVPEPAAALLGAFGLFGLLRRRRC